MDKSSLAYALIRVEGARDVSMGVPCGIDVGVGNYSGAIVPGGASGRTRVQSITDDGGAGLMHLDATAFSSGWVVRDTRVTRWRQRGYYRANGCLYVLGPYHAAGKSLVEVMRGGAGAVHYLSRLARALARLERLRVNIGVLHLRGVVFLDDGGVLFVSQDTVQLMCLYQGAGDAFNFSLPFNNQQLTGEGRLSFALAVLSYMALSGSLPWDAPSVKDLRNYMLSGVVPHIHYHNPAVKASIAQELNLILSKPTRSMPLLDYWVSSYAEWLQGGTHDTITERQGQENVRCAHVGYDERKRSFTRLRRLRENWLRGFVTVVLVGSVLLVSLFITGNRVTRNFTGYDTPVELLTNYYRSYNTLNSDRLIRIFASNDVAAARQSIDELRTVRLNSRLKMAVQFQSPLVDPAAWQAAGYPRLGGKRALYGYDSLEFTRVDVVGGIDAAGAGAGAVGEIDAAGAGAIGEIDVAGAGAAGAERVSYVVEYRKWLPQSFAVDQVVNGPGSSVGYLGRERIEMQKSGKSWVITDIVPLSKTYF